MDWVHVRRAFVSRIRRSFFAWCKGAENTLNVHPASGFQPVGSEIQRNWSNGRRPAILASLGRVWGDTTAGFSGATWASWDTLGFRTVFHIDGSECCFCILVSRYRGTPSDAWNPGIAPIVCRAPGSTRSTHDGFHSVCSLSPFSALH